MDRGIVQSWLIETLGWCWCPRAAPGAAPRPRITAPCTALPAQRDVPSPPSDRSCTLCLSPSLPASASRKPPPPPLPQVILPSSITGEPAHTDPKVSQMHARLNEFNRKLAYNRTRPYQHGGRTLSGTKGGDPS